MTMIAAPVINVDDNFLVTNGWTEAEPFTNPNDRPETSVLDPKPIVMRWNRREYVIPPGETKQVPFDCIRVNFGDPRAINTEQRFPGPDGRVGLIPKREAELIRLS